MRRLIIFFWTLFFFTLCETPSFGQSFEIDSLKTLVSKLNDKDTNKIIGLNELVKEYVNDGNYMEAVKTGIQSVELANKTGYTRGKMLANNAIAVAYYVQADYPKALDYYYTSLKEAEQVKDNKHIAKCYANIGLVYNDQKAPEKALEYYKKSLAIINNAKTKDLSALASCYTNMGMAYNKLSVPNRDSALICHYQALKIDSTLNNLTDIVKDYTNIAEVFNSQKKYELSVPYNQKSLRLRQQLDDKQGVAISYLNLGDDYYYLEKYPLALRYNMAALSEAKKIDALDVVSECYKQLAQVYEKTKNYEKAYAMQKKFQETNDTIFNVANSQAMSGARSKHNVEKKEIEMKAIAAVQKQRQQIIIYSISAILAIVAVFSLLVYNRYKLISKQKGIIEAQKQLVEHKNIEITQSINYALRIQQAILPVEEEIRSHIPQNFVLYKPKDIVSGDFYYFEHVGNTSFIAAVDCTGHGVPGAFMSMIGHDALNNIIGGRNISSPGKILDALNKEVRATLKQEENSTSTRDGMDVALCALTPNADGTTLCSFAGAMRPLWLIRNNGEMSMLKGDKQPIGGYYNAEDIPFTDKEVLLHPGDTFYIFSDGYADQFGGPDGKKLTTGRFKNLLQATVSKTMEEQRDTLDFALTEWLGENEQIDDVLVIGVKA